MSSQRNIKDDIEQDSYQYDESLLSFTLTLVSPKVYVRCGGGGRERPYGVFFFGLPAAKGENYIGLLIRIPFFDLILRDWCCCQIAGSSEI